MREFFFLIPGRKIREFENLGTVREFYFKIPRIVNTIILQENPLMCNTPG
jgi:hypothetical protein